jgi:hypothetical protein
MNAFFKSIDDQLFQKFRAFFGGGEGNNVTFPVQDRHLLVLLLSRMNPVHFAQS